MHPSKVSSYASNYFFKGNKNEEGCQIDMLVDRNDGIINVCEIKFYEKQFVIDKKYAVALQYRLDHFSKKLKKKKTILLTFITANGLLPNEYSKQVVDKQIVFYDLLK
jgi:uncharacterized protein